MKSRPFVYTDTRFSADAMVNSCNDASVVTEERFVFPGQAVRNGRLCGDAADPYVQVSKSRCLLMPHGPCLLLLMLLVLHSGVCFSKKDRVCACNDGTIRFLQSQPHWCCCRSTYSSNVRQRATDADSAIDQSSDFTC